MIAPATAQAATVTVSSTGAILYTAASGETNRVKIIQAGFNQYVVTDLIAIHPSGGCTSDSSTQARCTVPSGQVPTANVSLGDADDAADLSASGLAGPNTIHGGPGSDHMIGTPNREVFDGGADLDVVSYSGRTAPVTVTSNCSSTGFLCGPDGQQGENDDVQSVEHVVGGSGNDSIAGPFNAYLDGGPGNDLLVGSGGNDTLSGDAGSDTLYGFGGRDYLSAIDGEPDTINCSSSVELSVKVDLKDTISDATPSNPNGSCDNVFRFAVDQGPAIKVVSGSIRVHNGFARVRVHCPKSPEGRCAGRLTLARIVRVTGHGATPQRRGTIKVTTSKMGSLSYGLKVGVTKTLRVPVHGPVRGRVQVRTTEKDAHGKPKTTEATRRLRG